MQTRMKGPVSRRRSSPPAGRQDKGRITKRKTGRVYQNHKMSELKKRNSILKNRMQMNVKKIQEREKRRIRTGTAGYSLGFQQSTDVHFLQNGRQTQKELGNIGKRKSIKLSSVAKKQHTVSVKSKHTEKESGLQQDDVYIAPVNHERDLLIKKAITPEYKYKSRKMRKLRKKYIRKDRNELVHCCKVAAVRKIATKFPYVNRNLKREKEESEEKQAEQTEEKAKKAKQKKKGGFVKDSILAAAKGQVQSLKGGEEILESVDIIKNTTQETVSLVKTAVKTTADTGKTIYHSGRKTAEAITGMTRERKRMAGVRSIEEYNGKISRGGHGKRENNNSKNNDNNNGDDKEPEEKKEKKKKKEKKNQGVAKKRMLAYIQNKSAGKQDSLGSVAKDIAKNKAKQIGNRIGAAIGKKILTVVASAFGGALVVILPVIIIVVVIFQSPFAIFFGDDKEEENIQNVLSEYYADLSNDIRKKADEDGYDRIRIKSNTGEVDAEVSKGNYADVLCVFAEKYGYEIEIVDVTKKVKKRLKTVFDDMNYYSVKDTTKTKTKTNKKGETVEKKIKIRTITITQKNWQDMIDTYKFSADEKDEITELMEIAEESGIMAEIASEEYSAYTGTDTCIDGKVYDNPNSPVYQGSCAKLAKKTKNYIRPILKKKGMEPYIDIIVSMVQQESTFGIGDNANWMQVSGYSGASGMASVKAGIDHFEGLLKLCQSKKISDIKILIQSYNFGQGYITYAKNNGGKDTVALQKKFQKKQDINGNYGTAGYSRSVMSRVKGQKPKVTAMPQYFQTDAQWNNVRFGTSTIGKSGCGVCSSAMVVSYWTGKTVTPKKLVSFCHSYYISGAGASWSMIPAVASHYSLKCKDLGTSKDKMVEELKKGHTIIAIMHTGYFTSGGHFIVLRSIDSKGNISVNDCGSRTRTAKTYSAAFIQSNNPANYWSIYK